MMALMSQKGCHSLRRLWQGSIWNYQNPQHSEYCSLPAGEPAQCYHACGIMRIRHAMPIGHHEMISLRRDAPCDVPRACTLSCSCSCVGPKLHLKVAVKSVRISCRLLYQLNAHQFCPKGWLSPSLSLIAVSHHYNDTIPRQWKEDP